MRRALIAILTATAIVVPIVLLTGGISDDSKSSDENAERVQRVFVGARGCMPAEERRRLDRIQARSEARYAYLLSRLPSDADDESKAKAAQEIFADKKLSGLLAEATRMIAPYQPDGRRYDRACYEGAWERFKRRAERQE